jgi:uncharacterized membrane protein YdcZ (DUF606 family)
MARSAARFPEHTALSIVAGKLVSVQSPASARLRRAVRTPGRRAFCSGVAANSLKILDGVAAARSTIIVR